MLRITEIFYSLQGETSLVGWPTVFVRLTGCPLRCQYCDTAYAFSGGKKWSLEDILKEVSKYERHVKPRITVTGGEPLAQRNVLILLKALCDANYQVSLETSGALDISEVDPRVIKILDIKTPGSKESHRNLWENLAHMTPHKDEFKFVICHREDYDWSVQHLNLHRLWEKGTVLFSPSATELPAKQLSDWILEDQLPVRFQLQLHKILGVA